MHSSQTRGRSRAHQAAQDIWKAVHGPHRLETAGRHLAQHIPITHGDDSVSDILAQLYGRTYDSVDAVYVVSETGRLEGAIRLRELLAAPLASRLGGVMRDAQRSRRTQTRSVPRWWPSSTG